MSIWQNDYIHTESDFHIVDIKIVSLFATHQTIIRKKNHYDPIVIFICKCIAFTVTCFSLSNALIWFQQANRIDGLELKRNTYKISEKKTIVFFAFQNFHYNFYIDTSVIDYALFTAIISVQDFSYPFGMEHAICLEPTLKKNIFFTIFLTFTIINDLVETISRRWLVLPQISNSSTKA